MLTKTLSAAVFGIDAAIVEIEANLTEWRGDGSTAAPVIVVGLPDPAIRESRERIKAAIRNSGFYWPPQKITINLAPADLRKEGTLFDLPIAVALLGGSGELNETDLDDTIFVGELALNGRVRAVKGALPIAMAALRRGYRRLVLPEENAREAAVVQGIDVYPVCSLNEVIILLNAAQPVQPLRTDPGELLSQAGKYTVDYAEVRGQYHAKRAIEVATAGGHNIAMIGPPGSGKTMLAKRIPSILPPMSFAEALETTKIHSVAGLSNSSGLVGSRPFRAPHHTISDAGLIGGGNIPRPGEVSLAHNGVLFLDELPEFERNVLEVLRQPLEDHQVTISRASMSLTFPAAFMLVAAMNPCQCGYYGDSGRECRCTLPQIQRYISKVSGPLLDRIDIHINVPAVKVAELADKEDGEPSSAVRERVIGARLLQLSRFEGERVFCNAQMTPRLIRRHCRLSGASQKLIEEAMHRMGLSARAYDRILKVSRTLADLEGEERIEERHLAEAVQYRSLDRAYWQ